jgi:hypothetical protein
MSLLSDMGSHEHEMLQGVSAHTADLYDRATSATASREPISDKGRRKRPAFLALHNEDRDNAFETARYVQSWKEKEQLRRSSPTVGEGFEFRVAPEMARAMPVQPVDGRNGLAHRAEGPPAEVQREEDEDADDDDDENYDAEDEDLEQHLDDPPAPPEGNLEPAATLAPDRLDPITEEISPKPKRQKSCSSVRSQIIALPETARLRKQASGELARQREQMPTPTPSMPSLRTFQGLSKAASEELLSRPRTSERNQKYTISDTTQLAIRPRRGPSKRVSRDAGPHPNIPLPPTPLENHFGIAVSSLSRTPTPLPPNGVLPPAEDAWPLTPEVCNMPPPPFSPTHSRAASQQEPSFPALRSISPESVVTLRPSRSNTPQFSNSSAPYGPLPPTSTTTSSTPRKGRSRSNTSATLNEDALYAAAFDDGASIAASSVAPSTMSAQWYRTPRERLGLGSRIRAEHVPWEQLDRQVAADEDDERARSRKVQLFTIYPPRSPTSPMSPMDAAAAAAAAQQGPSAAHAAQLAQLAEMAQQQPPQYQPYPQHNHSSSHSNQQLQQLQQLQQAQIAQQQVQPRDNSVPPRSPLLTDKFLTGVRTLPEDPPRQVSAAPPPPPTPVPLPARTLSLRTLSRRSRRGGSADDDGGGKSSKKSDDGGGGGSRSTSGSRMGGRFPTLGELVTEYKSMAHRFYTAGSSSSRDDAPARRRPSAPTPGVFGGSSTMLDAAPPPSEARMRELHMALHRDHRRHGSAAAAAAVADGPPPATTNGTTTPATATPKSERHGRSQSTSNLSLLLRSASRSARASRAASAAAKAAAKASRDAEDRGGSASVPPSRAGSATPNGLLAAAAAATPTPKRKERKISFFRRRGDGDEGDVSGSAKKSRRARSRSGAV